MGGGSYSYNDAVTRSRSYRSQSIEKTFSKKNLDSEMNPLNINFRESRDSEEHPESFPIIIALDETGSMSKVPKYLIDNTLPDCVASIMKAGIDNPQICFMAFGDVEGCYEEAPLQVGQFESSDELMEKWLRKVDLEGKGGGNGFNPYPMDLDTYFTLEEPSNTDDGPQGKFKTGPFDYPLFKRAVERHCLDNYSETYHCKFNIVITHWDCLKTTYIPTICDFQDRSPRIIGITRFIHQLRTGNCAINDIYLGKSEDSNIKEL